MTNTDMVLIVRAAGSKGLSGRDKIQLIIYIAQQAGYNYGCTFEVARDERFYSYDVALKLDCLTNAKFLNETLEDGVYTYKLRRGVLKHITAEDKKAFKPQESFIKELIAMDVESLQVISLITHIFTK